MGADAVPTTVLAAQRGGVALRAVDAGPRDGPVVILLHGFPQDSGCWHSVVPLLHSAGLRTLALDQRGYGRSDRPPGVAPYRVEELAADVCAVLDAAGTPRAHVVGHDWGGAVAWELAARFPDRVNGMTVLSTPHPAAYAWSLTHSGQALMSWYTAAFQLPVLPETVLALALAPVLRASGLPADTAGHYAARLSRPLDLGPPLAWYRAAVRRPRGGTHDEASMVDVPTTYLWGRHDPTLGRAAAERTREHVRGPFWFVELDAGHWLPELEPVAVARAVLARMANP